MDFAEVIRRSDRLLAAAGIKKDNINQANFLDYADNVKDAVDKLGKRKQKRLEWLPDFVQSLRMMRDDFAQIVEKDPLVTYRPAHTVSLEFHQSPSKIRYFRGGNRISKTQSGVAEVYWTATDQHPYRTTSPLPASVFIIGINFSKYAGKVFESKYITGEGGNPLSPVFPEHGKWFHHYDPRKYILTLRCKQCANNDPNKLKKCNHPKSSITLFSDQEGAMVLQGGQYALGQFDEQIQYEFFGEALKRINTVPHSGIIVTETPLKGRAFWTHTVLTKNAQDQTKIPGSNTNLVSLHTIDQFEAGLVDHNTIKADMALMTEPEIRARVYGEPVAFTEAAVFDLVEIGKLRTTTRLPNRYYISAKGFDSIDDGIKEHDEDTQIEFLKDENGPLRIWEPVNDNEQYIIGVDVAQGLTKGDYSCASVLRLIPTSTGFNYELVAQYHDWVNPVPYAGICYLLGLYYNQAYIVVERNGPGISMLYQLVHELSCFFTYKDIRNPAQSVPGTDIIYGITTDKSNKGTMISILQGLIKNKLTGSRNIDLWCDQTLDELENYVQETTESGLTTRFKGEGQFHDDRVMSLALATYASKITPTLYDFDRVDEIRSKNKLKGLDGREHGFWSTMQEELRELGKPDEDLV